MKILVVDDETLLVKGIRFNLQNEGYEVITGSDGQEAVDLVKDQAPDLVVLDVMMPNMDGLTACRKRKRYLILEEFDYEKVHLLCLWLCL